MKWVEMNITTIDDRRRDFPIGAHLLEKFSWEPKISLITIIAQHRLVISNQPWTSNDCCTNLKRLWKRSFGSATKANRGNFPDKSFVIRTRPNKINRKLECEFRSRFDDIVVAFVLTLSWRFRRNLRWNQPHVRQIWWDRSVSCFSFTYEQVNVF